MNRTKEVACWVAAVFFAAAFAIGLHQFVIYGYWFEVKDFLHHENFMVVAAVIGAMLLVLAFKK
jgi:hypothetical protein